MPQSAYPNDPYTLWCQRHGCHHGHCPHAHEHPQPVCLDDGRLVCGYCLFKLDAVTEMVACTPATCRD
jgi:hypothetical protein